VPPEHDPDALAEYLVEGLLPNRAGQAELQRRRDVRRAAKTGQVDQPSRPGLEAANRMTAAEALALNLGDHSQVVGQILRVLGEAGYLAHAEPAALTEDRYRRKTWRTPTRGPKGWPDIVAVRPYDGRLVVVEVKTGKGRATPEQRRWLEAFGALADTNPRVWVGIVGPASLQAFYDAVIPDWEEPSP
jgi:VRR-NUC domain